MQNVTVYLQFFYVNFSILLKLRYCHYDGRSGIRERKRLGDYSQCTTTQEMS